MPIAVPIHPANRCAFFSLRHALTRDKAGSAPSTSMTPSDGLTGFESRHPDQINRPAFATRSPTFDTPAAEISKSRLTPPYNSPRHRLPRLAVAQPPRPFARLPDVLPESERQNPHGAPRRARRERPRALRVSELRPLDA